jgi:hypothetical protein
LQPVRFGKNPFMMFEKPLPACPSGGFLVLSDDRIEARTSEAARLRKADRPPAAAERLRG